MMDDGVGRIVGIEVDVEVAVGLGIGVATACGSQAVTTSNATTINGWNKRLGNILISLDSINSMKNQSSGVCPQPDRSS
jgi:hypothetical protein